MKPEPEPLSAAVGRGHSEAECNGLTDPPEPSPRAPAGLQLHRGGGRPH